MKTFSLSIELGNGAMRSEHSVAQALQALAPRIARDGFEQGSWRILDDNGNTVGCAEMDVVPGNQTLIAIQELLDQREWNADTLDAVANILRKGGYAVATD
jgi:hypothetical protein